MPSMRQRGAGGLVYATEGGRMCPRCRQPLAACCCAPAAAASGDGVVRVGRETAGRGGKAVALVRGLPQGPDARAALSKQPKAACGSGGTVKEGVIEVQGDHRDRIVAWLQDQGYRVKRVGA